MFSNSLRIGALVFLLIAIGLLAYGYWFNATHGSLYVTVTDTSDREHPHPVVPVALSFLDSGGNVVAQADGTEPSGTIYLTSPQVYSCHEVEQKAPFDAAVRKEWDECFERQSRWVSARIRSVRTVDVRADSCEIHGMPVALSEHPDTWWLWWVPMRHIGGMPYTSFSIQIEFDRSRCG
jgi:hypothetical protein